MIDEDIGQHDEGSREALDREGHEDRNGTPDVRSDRRDEDRDECSEHSEWDREPDRHSNKNHREEEANAVDEHQQHSRVEVAARLSNCLVPGPANALLVRWTHVGQHCALEAGRIRGEIESEHGDRCQVEDEADAGRSDSDQVPEGSLRPVEKGLFRLLGDLFTGTRRPDFNVERVFDPDTRVGEPDATLVSDAGGELSNGGDEDDDHERGSKKSGEVDHTDSRSPPPLITIDEPYDRRLECEAEEEGDSEHRQQIGGLSGGPKGEEGDENRGDDLPDRLPPDRDVKLRRWIPEGLIDGGFCAGSVHGVLPHQLISRSAVTALTCIVPVGFPAMGISVDPDAVPSPAGTGEWQEKERACRNGSDSSDSGSWVPGWRPI